MATNGPAPVGTVFSIRRSLHDILAVDGEHPYSHAFDVAIMSLIALNVVAVMLATVEGIFQAYRQWFFAIELVSVTVFTGEYLGRLWTCTLDDEYANPIVGRLRFALHPLLVIDLLAILPFFVGAFFIDLRFLRALRLFRFFRLLKLARYSDAMQGFAFVFREKKEDLTIALSATTVLLLIASSLMYFAERHAQPEAFSSIPEALWWGVVTLTTVGYGDVYPVTPIGRLLGSVIAVLGVGLVALPASILASGFIEEEERTDGICPHCGEYVDELEDPKQSGVRHDAS